MSQLLNALLQFVPLLFLLVLGYGVGHYREKKHVRELDKKEEELRCIGISNHKRIPGGAGTVSHGVVTGCVVVATDYFKVFASILRNIFGGEMRAFQTLVTRGRREAIVRMLTEAKELGANAVINVRFETATIGGHQKKRKPGGIEVLAYGTALTVADESPGQG